MASIFFNCIHNFNVNFLFSTECAQEFSEKFIKKNKFLLEIKPDELRKSIRRLKRLNLPLSDIKMHPTLLAESEFRLQNNYQRLQEVGFSEVTAYRLANTKKIISKSVHFNQTFNFLPKNINILKNIYAVAKVPYGANESMTYEREMQLESVHRMALRNYMLNHIKYTPSDLDEMYFIYPNLKYRSLQSIHQSALLLQEAYKTAINQLPRSILIMQPEEIQELLDVGTVCGIDVLKVMILAPKCTLARIKETQIVCYTYRIPEYVLTFTPKLFFINADTLQDRIKKICKLKRGTEFLQHIAIGRVILSMERIQTFTKLKKIRFSTVFNDKFVE